MSKFNLNDSGATILQKLNNTIVTVGKETGVDYFCNGTNDTAQIQAAIDYVSSIGGGKILIRSGAYYISAVMNLESNIIMQGEGDSTLFQRSVYGNFSFFETHDKTNIVVSDIKINDDGTSTTGWTPLYFINCSYVKVERVHTVNAGWHGLEFNNSDHCIAVDCLDEDAGDDSYQIDRMDDTDTCNHITFMRCRSINSGASGFTLHKKGMRDIKIIDCYVEGATNYAVEVKNAGGYTADSTNIQVLNSYFKDITAGGVVINNAHNCLVSGNYFEDVSGYNIFINGVSTSYILEGAVVENNTIKNGAISIVSGGTGYTTASNVAVTGGSGTLLTLDIIAVDGIITSATINTVGVGYLQDEVVAISGGGANATIKLDGKPSNYAIVIGYSKYAKVLNNHVEQGYYTLSAKDSILIDTCDYSVVANNTCVGAPRNGIRIGTTSGANITSHSIVENNTLNRTTGGILCHYQKDTKVLFNTMIDCSRRNIYFDASDTNSGQIIGNFISNTGGDYGITFEGREQMIVEGNRIEATTSAASKDGISIYTGNNKCIVRGNYITGYSRSGIQIWGTAATDNIIESNVITGCDRGIYQTNVSASNTMLEKNNCFSNTTADYSVGVGTYKAHYNVGLADT